LKIKPNLFIKDLSVVIINLIHRQEVDSEAGDKPRSRRFSEASEIFHETAGWRNLETSVKCLQAMVAGLNFCFSFILLWTGNRELLGQFINLQFSRPTKLLFNDDKVKNPFGLFDVFCKSTGQD
jgi:hypothetical protein